eukprot:4430312-Pleurochrysis_carterae.AAC.1
MFAPAFELSPALPLSLSQPQARMRPSGETPLHLCAQQPKCCALLLRAGAPLEERDTSGCTPLQHAVCGIAPLHACAALLQAGAKPNTTDYMDRQAPLHRLCDHGGKESGTDTLSLFLQHGAVVNMQDKHGHTPLHLAAFRNHATLALALIAAGASPNVPSAEGLCPLASTDPSPRLLRGGHAVSQSLRRQMITCIPEPPPWLPDTLANDCQLCSSPFSTANRRHHCRHCGRIACAACSKSKLAIHKFGVNKPTRVCAECATVLQARAHSRAVQMSFHPFIHPSIHTCIRPSIHSSLICFNGSI